MSEAVLTGESLAEVRESEACRAMDIALETLGYPQEIFGRRDRTTMATCWLYEHPVVAEARYAVLLAMLRNGAKSTYARAVTGWKDCSPIVPNGKVPPSSASVLAAMSESEPEGYRSLPRSIRAIADESGVARTTLQSRVRRRGFVAAMASIGYNKEGRKA